MSASLPAVDWTGLFEWSMKYNADGSGIDPGAAPMSEADRKWCAGEGRERGGARGAFPHPDAQEGQGAGWSWEAMRGPVGPCRAPGRGTALGGPKKACALFSLFPLPLGKPSLTFLSPLLSPSAARAAVLSFPGSQRPWSTTPWTSSSA